MSNWFKFFAQSTAVILPPYYVQNFKTIDHLRHELWINEIWRDLGVRYVSDGYHVIIGACVQRYCLPGYYNVMLHISHTASYCSPGCYNRPYYRFLTWIPTVTGPQCTKKGRCLFQRKHENVKGRLLDSKYCLSNTTGAGWQDLNFPTILLNTKYNP